LKPRGDLSDEVMAAIAEKFNKDYKDNATEISMCSKFAFSPYLAVSFLSLFYEWFFNMMFETFCGLCSCLFITA
jgi:hypothetical protein